jgi:transcription antitermination factor NusG
MNMQYQVGQQLPPASPPSYFGDQITPRWHCVITPPEAKHHDACRAFFRAAGMFAFYPSEDRHRMTRGRRYTSEAPIVPGYVFAQCLRDPLWHIWRHHDWFLRVFRIGEEPYSFAYAQIRHLQRLTVDAERLRRAQAAMQAEVDAASRPVAGMPAHIVAGPFKGSTVTPDSIIGNEALFEMFGIKMRADTSAMRRA